MQFLLMLFLESTGAELSITLLLSRETGQMFCLPTGDSAHVFKELCIMPLKSPLCWGSRESPLWMKWSKINAWGWGNPSDPPRLFFLCSNLEHITKHLNKTKTNLERKNKKKKRKHRRLAHTSCFIDLFQHAPYLFKTGVQHLNAILQPDYDISRAFSCHQ